MRRKYVIFEDQEDHGSNGSRLFYEWWVSSELIDVQIDSRSSARRGEEGKMLTGCRAKTDRILGENSYFKQENANESHGGN